MTEEQEFRKQTEEAKFEAFALMCKKVADLEKENKILTQNLEDTEIINKTLEKRINRAKECMKKLLFIINSDPANYNCKGLVQNAEDFIHNKKCSIRQHGEYCITEERCIMCDK